ncbi:hypothetical protein HYX07_02100 [Candidatus Woesearchaeota archaeon]|nr:hypothetical protein [Candidatus Woesearchaeota archaeon]
MDPKKKLDILKGSLESGIIDREEYKKWEEKLGPEAKELDDKIEEKMQEIHRQEQQEPKKSDKTLIIAIAAIVLLFAAVVAFSIFYKQEPKTLEELHVENLKGKLKPEQGYVYKGVYSFVTLDGLWYTQLTSPKGSRIYSLALRYSPKDLKDIVIEGNMDTGFFDSKPEFFVTFNPTGKEFSFIGLAVADFNTHMSKVFEKNPIAACDRNETEPCQNRPIVTCEDKDKLVLYVKESDKFRAYYNENCIVVEGKGLDLVKGVDRILYNLYGIMEQEEV